MIAELLDKLEKSNIQTFAYADDIVFVATSPSKIKQGLEILDSWCKENNMEVNTAKSGILHIFHKANP